MSNTEVWDLRTFHLLKTVPALNQSQVCFSPVNNAIYSIALEQDNDDNDEEAYDSSFRTLDASDYSSIGKIVFASISKKYQTFQISIYNGSFLCNVLRFQ